MSTIPADDRCRKFADYIVDDYIDSGCDFAPDLWASSPQQSPTAANAAESLHADYTRGELTSSATYGALDIALHLSVF